MMQVFSPSNEIGSFGYEINIERVKHGRDGFGDRYKTKFVKGKKVMVMGTIRYTNPTGCIQVCYVDENDEPYGDAMEVVSRYHTMEF